MTTDAAPHSRFRQTMAILLLCRVPFWQRSPTRRIARFLVLAGYLYAGTLVVLLALEDRFLFPGATFGRPWRESPDHLHVRELTLDSASGERIHAWFSAPEGWAPQRGAILFSHGNGGNLSRISGRALQWRQQIGRAVLLYDYPGYGKSTGRPSEAACYAAGEAAFRWLIEEEQVPAGEVILVGESMGGAIATELATRHATRLLVLHGAFTSFQDMAQIRVPYYPSRYLVHNRMDNEAKIGHVHCPVLLSHGTADTVVPFSHGERLFAAAGEPKRFVRMEGHGHGPPDRAEFFEMVRTFLTETAR
jgi:pimeloyl-ACP methyl ester carboxylesterase